MVSGRLDNAASVGDGRLDGRTRWQADMVNRDVAEIPDIPDLAGDSIDRTIVGRVERNLNFLRADREPGRITNR